MATVKKHRFIVKEYHKMGEAGIFGEDDRVELIDGEVVKMTPIGWRHAWCVNTLNMLLARLVQSRYVVSVQNPLKISEHGEPQPDLVLLAPKKPSTRPSSRLRGRRPDRRGLRQHPRLRQGDQAAPVLRSRHRGGLADGSRSETIEVHSGPGPGVYRKTARFGRGERVESATVPNLVFDTSETLPPQEPEAKQ